MQTRSYHSRGYLVFRVEEVIEVKSDVKFLATAVEHAVEEGEAAIAVAFPDDSYLSSTSLAVLIRCGHALQEVGGRFAVITGNRQVQEVIDAFGIGNLINLVASEEELSETVDRG
jgi:anti-anti-sigma factor